MEKKETKSTAGETPAVVTAEKVKFGAEIGENIIEFEFVVQRFVLPGFGTMTAEEAVENPEALAKIVDIGASVIQEVSSTPKNQA